MGNERWSSALVDISRKDGGWMLRQKKGIGPFTSDDPDSERIWWQDAGVNQNLAFPVHPDPISGMHAWHQRVRLTAAEAGDRYGDVFVDTDEVPRGLPGMARPDQARSRPRQPATTDVARPTGEADTGCVPVLRRQTADVRPQTSDRDVRIGESGHLAGDAAGSSGARMPS